MTRYAYTLKLHGGTKGAKNSHPDVAIGHYRKVLENRINCIKAEIAKAAYHYQVPGTSVIYEDRPRWSCAFRANWKVQVGKEGKWESVIEGTQKRFPWDFDGFGEADERNNHAYEFAKYVDLWKAEQLLNNSTVSGMSVDEPIFVYNPSPYARWLNNGGDGGKLEGTFKTFAFHQTGDGKWLQPALDFIGNGYNAVKEDINGIIDRGLANAATMKAKG